MHECLAEAFSQFAGLPETTDSSPAALAILYALVEVSTGSEGPIINTIFTFKCSGEQCDNKIKKVAWENTEAGTKGGYTPPRYNDCKPNFLSPRATQDT